MSLPQIEEVRRRIESCKDYPIQMILKAIYLTGGRGIELAGKLTASDLETNPNHQIYGPKGTDAWLAETEPPDIPQKEVAKLLITAISGDKEEALRLVDKFTKNVPVAIFKIKIAKQHLESGEEAPYRLIALPLVDEFEPWAKEMYDYFKAAGDNYVFANLSRQDVWHYITHTQRIFEGLNYRIKKYIYLRNGAVIEQPVKPKRGKKKRKGEPVLSHNRKLKGHGVRHVRIDELLKRFHFDGVDIAAFVGWSMGQSQQISQSPAMMENYAEIREMWQRYIKKLCKPNSFKSGGVS
jgi:hypothetical protein